MVARTRSCYCRSIRSSRPPRAILARCLGSRGEAAAARRADPEHPLLSRGIRIYCGACGLNPGRARRGSRRIASGSAAVQCAWAAGENRQGWRPLSAGDGSDRRGAAADAQPAGYRFGRVLPEPGRARLPGSGPRSKRNCGGPVATGSASSSCPVSFVSEHSETLVELDREYRHLCGTLRGSVLSPRADRRCRSPVYRRAGRSGSRRRDAAKTALRAVPA